MIPRERLAQLDRMARWAPQPGPQLEAFLSPADQLLYGGAAGGGKSDLGIGLALTRHRRTLYIRREATQLEAVIDRVAEVLGNRTGYNGQKNVWRLPRESQIRFGGVPNLGDENRFQGSARDLLVLDEAAHLLEDQARFLLGWVRTAIVGQRCRAVLCTNPPTSAEGEWIIRWFAPWLDPKFPNPAAPGELRWVAMLPQDGGTAVEQWVDGPEPFMHRGELIQPISRTFIPSRVQDNRFYRDTNYVRQLQALPEPLRSQMLRGDFTVGRKDDDWQVIPSAWVKAAMDRWKELPKEQLGEVTSAGVDPSGGGDEATIATRRGWRYDPLVAVPPDASGNVSGGAIAKRALDLVGDVAAVHVDIIGIGATAGEHLEAYIGGRMRAINGASDSTAKDLSGKLSFQNLRAECWWKMREALAPERPAKVALPPDTRLFSDLCAPRYRLTSRGILVEDKKEVKRRLGRSPDRGDAVVLAAIRTPVVRDRRG